MSAITSRRLRPVVDALPESGGAYVLDIMLGTAIAATLAGIVWTLPAGRYLYCGSARGPGGLKARIARHLRRRKPVHWHVDRLTTRGTVRGVWLAPGGDECALVARLSALPVPIPGFGSSDCDHCRSHLLACPAECSIALDDLVRIEVQDRHGPPVARLPSRHPAGDTTTVPHRTREAP